MLHHFFVHRALGEKEVHLINCMQITEQEYAIIVQYLLRRVMMGQHDEISLPFMIPGHTKFSPDWCFGLLKKKYRRTKVGGHTDLISVVLCHEHRTVHRYRI